MTLDVLERPGSSEALSDFQWQSRQPRQSMPRQYGPFTDITSVAQVAVIPFGQHALVLQQPLPSWSHGLLWKISELGDLETGWDSYGARPVDPECAAAAVDFLLDLLDSSTPQPSIVPTSRGGIQLEWHRLGADLEIEIESPARFHVFFEDERTGEETEVTLTDNLLPLMPLLDRLSAVD